MRLGPVLMAYRTTAQTSTGKSPFHLLYGRDAKLQYASALDFYTPRPPVITVASEYGRELFQELRIKELARQHIRKAQVSQKEQYDKHSKKPVIRADLVMLKVDPKFKLHHSFHGPYRVYSVTATCACIQPVNCPDKENFFTVIITM